VEQDTNKILNNGLPLARYHESVYISHQLSNTVHDLEIMPWIMRKMEYHPIIIVTQIIAAFKKHFVTLYQSLAYVCYQKLYNSQKEDERGPMLHS